MVYFSTSKSPVSDQESFKVMWLCLGLIVGTPTPKGGSVVSGLPWKVKCLGKHHVYLEDAMDIPIVA